MRFNLCVGNNDSHAKNLSVLQAPGGQYRLAPFHDLMGTAIYPGLARNFALSIGGEMKPGAIGSEQLEAVARELGFAGRNVRAVRSALTSGLLRALALVRAALSGQALAGTERTLVERLGRWINTNTQTLAKRCGWQP